MNVESLCGLKVSNGSDGFTISKAKGEIGTGHEDLLSGAEVAAAAEEKETHAFEVDPAQVIYKIFLKSNTS